MKSVLCAFAGIAVVVALSAALSAKGSTSRITIAGPNLSSPIELTAANVVQAFQIWAGPGTKTCMADWENCVEGAEGFIVDWSSGPVTQRPDGLQRYEVSFYVVDDRFPERPRPREQLAYVVSYEFDARTAKGYVYLPGRDDPRFTLNTRSILRRVEGNWFRASRAWQNAVVPLISHAE